MIFLLRSFAFFSIIFFIHLPCDDKKIIWRKWGGSMVYSKLVKLIEDNQAELTRRSVKELRERSETKEYLIIPEDLLIERVSDVYSRLVGWLNKEKRATDITKYYKDLGRRRFQEDIPVSEVILAFMLLKRNLWLFVSEKHFFDSTYQLYQALELNNKVVLFFDKIIHCAVTGYEDELYKAGQEKGGIFSRLMKKI
jgi:hypothetical protein